DRVAERVDDAAEQRLTDRHLEDALGRLDLIALGKMRVLAEHDRADRVLLEVERKAHRAARELDHLAVLHVGETVDADDAVRQRDDRADVASLGSRLEALNALANEVADLGS